ncbi:hypothetical protein BDN72DRAFT_767649, partial [Pluteus cervinus]
MTRLSRTQSHVPPHPVPTVPSPLSNHHDPAATFVSSPTSNEWLLPTPSQLSAAASLPIISSAGIRVPFGLLFELQKTIVIFIRHFWCPLCQDYMTSVKNLAKPEMLKGTRDVQLVIISNGAHTLIEKYKQIFNLPFNMYTDPTLAVYNALGMGKDKDEASYVKHGLVSGIALVMARAVKVKMRVWENGGDVGQLGGEFVLGPGLRCTFAHRMQTPKGHAPISLVLRAAGV